MSEAGRTLPAQGPAPTDPRGVAHALIAYGSWGIVPLFWKLLASVPAPQILAHRIAWSLLFLIVVLGATGRFAAVLELLRAPRRLLLLTLCALLIAFNWGLFIWAVTAGHLVDASLGYFINPLVNVVLGVFLLKERLSRPQTIAVALAATGLLLMFVFKGGGLLVALSLAASFATYGLLRKLTPVDALVGLFIETLVCAPFAIAYLVAVELPAGGGTGLFGRGEPLLLVWAVLAGPVTAIPLASFSAAARRLPLSTLGFFQYLSPSFQFLLAVLAFGERIDPGTLLAFAFIWAALAVMTLGWRRARVVADRGSASQREGPT